MKRLLYFRQWPILPKIMTISVISVSFVSAVILFFFSPHIERKLLEAKKEGLKNVVDVAFAVFHEYDALARNGQLTLAEAQARAARKIGELRYGDKEYFWINDVEMRMVMHPIRPELDGKDQTNTQDPSGKYLFRDFVNATRSNGSGVVAYLWPKPGEHAAVAKISYVRLYEPWGWVLGSGLYVDDVEKEMDRVRWVLITGTILFTVVTLSFAGLIGAGITRPLRKVIDGLQEIASGKGDIVLNKRIAITSIDEIGLLSSEFNSLMESIGSLTVFKKVIEEDDSVEEVYRRLGEVFTGQLGLGGCHIYEVIGQQEKMVQVYPVAGGRGELHCDPEVEGNCELCKAKRTAHTISSLTYPSICRHFRAEPGQQHCCIPLVVGGGTVGVVQLLFDASEGRASFREHEAKLFKVEQYIKESLPVIETKRLMNTLREASLRDPMTGLHNRRYLQEYTEKIVAGVTRRGKKIGLVMCDLDYFKQVNDTHGHAAGDLVLKETAAIIARSVRQSDIVIRFGGEEFLVVLLDVNEGEAMTVAEKIRERVQAAKIKLPDGTLNKTISLGISEFPTDTNTFWHCIKFADVALYRAKETGRNRSVRFESAMWKEEQF
ncbi:MAG TPA: diguanylate cyclase [Anaeromyxobacteraceae bacterium]